MSFIKNIRVGGVEYAIKDEAARASIGDLSKLETAEISDLVAAINAANKSGGPIKRIESDSSNYVYLRDLESGVYILYGYFRPYNGAASRLVFDNILTSVAADATGSHILAISTINSKVDFFSIEVDSTQSSGFAYSRTSISLRELYDLIGKVGDMDDLSTTAKESLVAAINELAAYIPPTAAVGQTIVVEEVDANGKPTKWRAADYQPRTHWSEEVELLKDVMLQFDENVGAEISECNFEFEREKTYAVTYNGERYICTATADDPAIVGNTAALGGVDNRLPFFMGVEDSTLAVVPLDGATEIIVSISEVIYNQIDERYLPPISPYIPEFNLSEMGLPVIVKDGETVGISGDFTTLFSALKNGFVKFYAEVSTNYAAGNCNVHTGTGNIAQFLTSAVFPDRYGATAYIEVSTGASKINIYVTETYISAKCS